MIPEELKFQIDICLLVLYHMIGFGLIALQSFREKKNRELREGLEK